MVRPPSAFALVPVLLVLVPGAAVRAEDEQAAAPTKLEALGGKVTRKEGVVTQVSFTDCSKLGDAELRAIGKLTGLKSLTIYGGCKGLNDDTVGHLATLKDLETLNTEGVQLSDDGLAKLAALKSLKGASFFHLSFRKEGFTGKGFAAWKDLPKLERLTVAGMSMGDEGFAAIATLTQLKELATWHTYQTEAGNAEIAKLPNLVRLHIGQRLPRKDAKAPSLGDASLPTLAGIKTLETLKIGEARFTLPALKGLKALPKLKKLIIYETDIAAADIDALKAELKDVQVEFQPLTDEQRKKLDVYLKQ
jgi:hypothetical protein